MIYNHEAFMEKIRLINDKDEQMRLMKDYWLSLPTEEFIAFMKNNMNDIGIGLEILVANNALSQIDKNLMNKDISNTISLVKTMKDDLKVH
jgi:hypothetical protein